MIEASASLIWSGCAVFALAQPINFKPIDSAEILGAAVGVIGIVLFSFLTRRLKRSPGWEEGYFGWHKAVVIGGLMAFVLMLASAMALTVIFSWLEWL